MKTQSTDQSADGALQVPSFSLSEAELSRWRGKCIVIKLGGEQLLDTQRVKHLLADVLLLHRAGVKTVVCHGGGPQINELLSAVGTQPRFERGLRVTDAATMRTTAMVLLGRLNAEIVALLNSDSARAVGVSGLDARLYCAEVANEQLGRVGRVTDVHVELLTLLLNASYLPVVAPIGIDLSGELLNLNADTAAAALAAALHAERLLVLTNVAGIYRDYPKAESLLTDLNAQELAALVASGVLSAGMVPKAEGVLHAIEGGVPLAHIFDGSVAHAVFRSLCDRESFGTRVRQ